MQIRSGPSTAGYAGRVIVSVLAKDPASSSRQDPSRSTAQDDRERPPRVRLSASLHLCVHHFVHSSRGAGICTAPATSGAVRTTTIRCGPNTPFNRIISLRTFFSLVCGGGGSTSATSNLAL